MLLLFFFLVCYLSFSQLFSLPALVPLSFLFRFSFLPDPCSVLSLRLSHILHSHTSLSHSSCTLIVNFPVAKIDSSCSLRQLIHLLCAEQEGREPRKERSLKLEQRDRNKLLFALSCSRALTTTIASLFISWGILVRTVIALTLPSGP